MMGDGFWFFGMHGFWWLFWLGVIVVFAYVLLSGPQRQERGQTPREILDRRYAAGEISKQEYEEQKKTLAQG